MQLRTIATCLGCVTLSADVLVIVTTEALFHPAGTVVELTLADVALPCHARIDQGVSHLWCGKFYDDRGCPLKRALSGQPTHVRYFSFGDHGIVVGQDLPDGRLLVFDVDGFGGDAVDNDSIGRHDKFCLVSQSFQPSCVLFELLDLCACAREYL